jgi:hypothetical protein
MAQGALPPTSGGTDDDLSLVPQAVAPAASRGVGAPNIAVPLPFLGDQQNGAITAHYDGPAPHSSQSPHNYGTNDNSQVGVPAAESQQAVEPLQANETLGADAKTVDPRDGDSSDDLSDVQNTDGSEPPASPDSDAGLDRLDRYAFNYVGDAYEHRVPQHLAGGITLFAEKVCMGILIQQHLENARNQDGSDVRPSLIPDDLEMKRTPKAVECIWVGMLPVVPKVEEGGNSIEASSKDGPKRPSRGQKKTRKTWSVANLEDDQFRLIPNNPNALRVVAKTQTKLVKTWHLYALTTSDNGSKLCQGWKVPLEDVFFFKAFRDDTAAGFMKRKHATDLKIKATIFPLVSIPTSAAQPSAPTKLSGSHVPDPVTPETGHLPSPESSGQKEKSNRTFRTANQTVSPKNGDPKFKEDDQARSPDDSVDADTGPTAERHSPAGAEPIDLCTVDDNEDEDAYPEYAPASQSKAYNDFLDSMVRELFVVDGDGVKQGQKRKRVAFDPDFDEVASIRRKTNRSFRGNMRAREGENDGDQRSTMDYLVYKLGKMVDKLVDKRDIAGLRQCVTLMGCIEKRGSPGHSSGLAPYLSTSSRRDADPEACNGKLREILVGLPISHNIYKMRKLISYP